MKKLAAEFLTIVLGVLIALGVDGWRQDREELKVASEHLSDITAELRQTCAPWSGSASGTCHASSRTCRPCWIS